MSLIGGGVGGGGIGRFGGVGGLGLSGLGILSLLSGKLRFVIYNFYFLCFVVILKMVYEIWDKANHRKYKSKN